MGVLRYSFFFKHIFYASSLYQMPVASVHAVWLEMTSKWRDRCINVTKMAFIIGKQHQMRAWRVKEWK